MKLIFFSLCFTVIFTGLAVAQPSDLMPVPSKMVTGEFRFRLTGNFKLMVKQPEGARTFAAASRLLRRIDDKTHLLIQKEPVLQVPAGDSAYMLVECQKVGSLLPGVDESYTLNVTGNKVRIFASTDIGALHGMETFMQLIEWDEKGYFIREVKIEDAPRFPWRGLLIDVARHFSPVAVIKRNIDGLAMVKMNVLHLHLTEDQGFRIESKVFPNLHLKGSNGDFYTQEEMRDIIRYANDRGIRVVPEFDMPGHATSWFVGHPELASAPGPYSIEKKFGVFDPTIDPTTKKTYKFLDKFLSEMCALFPDPYFHIGGDENNGKQWDANPAIQEFMKKNQLKSNHDLQNYFNTKVMGILTKNGKKMIGWDEILQPGLPQDAVIQSWRGKEGLKEAATKGYDVILSNGYYIDLSNPAWKHYTNDPLPADLSLTPEQQKKIMGGEATMWAELVTPLNIDSRIWPRTAAIAERLWSPAAINNIPDMYRRLATMALRLESAGLQHISYRDVMLRNLLGHITIGPLSEVADLIEPLKDYKRHAQDIPYSTDLPFTRMPDIAAPDAMRAWYFQELSEKWVRKNDTTAAKYLNEMLNNWATLGKRVRKVADGVPAAGDWIIMADRISALSEIGLTSIDAKLNHKNLNDEWIRNAYSKLGEAALPLQECELKITETIMMLFQYALPR